MKKRAQDCAPGCICSKHINNGKKSASTKSGGKKSVTKKHLDSVEKHLDKMSVNKNS